MQPQFHAGSGLTRIISSFCCSTTMQGPSHETQSRSPQGIACYRSRAICRPNAWCGMVLNSVAHAPSPLPVVLPLRQHNSDATGYTGLRRATQNRPRARRHAQNASICTVLRRFCCHQVNTAFLQTAKLQNKLPPPRPRSAPCRFSFIRSVLS